MNVMPEEKIQCGPGLDHLVRGFLKGLLKQMMRSLRAECGSLFLFDCRAGELVLDQFYHSSGLPLRGLRKGLSDGVSGQVINSKNPVFVKDIHSDPRFRGSGFSHYRTGSFISVPLYVRGAIFGVLNFSDKSGPAEFSDSDFAFASSLGAYGCMIIGGLQEFARMRRENAEALKEKELMEKYAAAGMVAVELLQKIKAPLDHMLTRADELLALAPSESPSSRYLREMRSGFKRIEKISGSFLAARHHDEFPAGDYVALSRLLDESIDVLKVRLDTAVRIVRQYGQDLPAIPDIGLEHVFVNIIKNALEAMPQGGELEIRAAVDDHGIRVSFTDSGTGIPNEFREQIFEPFFTTKERKGTGLGLSISQEIIRTCGGDIEVKSLPGQGSRFTVFIPLDKLIPQKI